MRRGHPLDLRLEQGRSAPYNPDDARSQNLTNPQGTEVPPPPNPTRRLVVTSISAHQITAHPRNRPVTETQLHPPSPPSDIRATIPPSPSQTRSCRKYSGPEVVSRTGCLGYTPVSTGSYGHRLVRGSWLFSKGREKGGGVCFGVLVSCEGRVGRGVTVAVSHGVCFEAMTYVMGGYGSDGDCGLRDFLALWAQVGEKW